MSIFDHSDVANVAARKYLDLVQEIVQVPVGKSGMIPEQKYGLQAVELACGHLSNERLSYVPIVHVNGATSVIEIMAIAGSVCHSAFKTIVQTNCKSNETGGNFFVAVDMCRLGIIKFARKSYEEVCRTSSASREEKESGKIDYVYLQRNVSNSAKFKRMAGYDNAGEALRKVLGYLCEQGELVLVKERPAIYQITNSMQAPRIEE